MSNTQQRTHCTCSHVHRLKWMHVSYLTTRRTHTIEYDAISTCVFEFARPRDQSSMCVFVSLAIFLNTKHRKLIQPSCKCWWLLGWVENCGWCCVCERARVSIGRAWPNSRLECLKCRIYSLIYLLSYVRPWHVKRFEFEFRTRNWLLSPRTGGLIIIKRRNCNFACCTHIFHAEYIKYWCIFIIGASWFSHNIAIFKLSAEMLICM